MADPFDPATARIAIVGAGAVGCYYGACLARQGHDVHFLMRSDLERVRRHGLHVRSFLGDFHLPSVQAHASTAEIGPCDLVIIALKSTANAALPTLLPPLLKPGTLLLTLQNGLGNEENLTAQFPDHPVLGGLCFVCINRTAPGHIHHIAQGRITLGELGRPAQARTQALAAAFRAAGVPCETDDSLALARWMKLVWNIPFNGLAIATGGCDTAALLADPHLSDLVRALMSEVMTAARALGHDLPESLADEMIARTRTMTQYKPSSLIDFEEGRKVELEAIWSEPLRQAQAAGVRMPRVEMLHQLIAAAQARRGSQTAA